MNLCVLLKISFLSLTTSIDKVLLKINTLKENLGSIDKAKGKVIEYMDSILVVAEESPSVTEQVSASAKNQSSATETIIASIQEQNGMIENLTNLISTFKL